MHKALFLVCLTFCSIALSARWHTFDTRFHTRKARERLISSQQMFQLEAQPHRLRGSETAVCRLAHFQQPVISSGTGCQSSQPPRIQLYTDKNNSCRFMFARGSYVAALHLVDTNSQKNGLKKVTLAADISQRSMCVLCTQEVITHS